MPIIFVHGVAVRDDAAFGGISAFLRQYVAPKLRPGDPEAVGVYAAFWGTDAVTFAWGGRSRPRTAVLHKGAADTSTVDQALMLSQFGAALSTLPHVSPASGNARPMGPSASDATRVAAGTSISAMSRDQRIDLVALALAASAFETTDDRPVPLDEDLARRIIEADRAVDAGTDSVAKLIDTVRAPGDGALAKGGSGWFSDLRDTLSEAVSRVGDAPGFVLTRALEELRVPLNNGITRFVGDVFVYLSRRGGELQSGAALPEIGTIPRDFLDVLVKAQREHPDEKTVVLTHSMGGQIVYDAVTRFLPDYPEFANTRPIDLWCACASQVGLFEEMKLFIRSDRTLAYDARVPHPRIFGRVNRWLNFWDRNDVISYTARPIFADLENDDQEFIGGATLMNAHGAYLVRPSFYRKLADAL